MAKHRMLPEFVYQRQLPVSEKVKMKIWVVMRLKKSVTDEGQEEFDEGSDEDIDITTDDRTSGPESWKAD